MASLEERVAYLEGQGTEHAAAIAEVRLDVRELRGEVRDLRTEMNRRFDQMDAKFDTKFAWLIGFQFATMLAVIGALLNAHFR